ncbi:MAG: hypothetical protein HQL40_16025, partial [Alphaproteobacteria bacterium]|nr:hypothetical protein [Alphaproteobacteria bacterium]
MKIFAFVMSALVASSALADTGPSGSACKPGPAAQCLLAKLEGINLAGKDLREANFEAS